MCLHVLRAQQFRSTEKEDRENTYLYVLVYVAPLVSAMSSLWAGGKRAGRERKELHYIAPGYQVVSLRTAKVVTE